MKIKNYFSTVCATLLKLIHQWYDIIPYLLLQISASLMELDGASWHFNVAKT